MRVRVVIVIWALVRRVVLGEEGEDNKKAKVCLDEVVGY